MFKFRGNSLFRGLARFCDYSILFLCLGAISLFLPIFYDSLFYYLLALLIPFLWIPIEALFVARFGTTPGKSLFGFNVRHILGYKLSYAEAFKFALFLPGKCAVVRQLQVSWFRKLLGVIIGCTVATAALCGNALTEWSTGLDQGIPKEGWVHYTPEDEKFRISFPEDPEEESKELIIPNGKVLSYEEATHKNKKMHYSVVHLELPGKWRLAASATLLKEVLNQLVAYADDTEILSKEFSKFGKYRVLDYRLRQGKDLVKGRMIIVSGVLYKLTMTYPPSYEKEVEASPFLDSFEVI